MTTYSTDGLVGAGLIRTIRKAAPLWQPTDLRRYRLALLALCERRFPQLVKATLDHRGLVVRPDGRVARAGEITAPSDLASVEAAFFDRLLLGVYILLPRDAWLEFESQDDTGYIADARARSLFQYFSETEPYPIPER